MRRFFYSLAFLMTAVCANAQNYEVRTLTFEDSDFKGTTKNYAGNLDWSSLIDAQYGGPMLYPTDFDDEEDILYYWYDEGNTEIYSELNNSYMDGCYWAGGIAISNYVDADLANGDYLHQLAVPKSNGSANFAVVFCNSNPTISEYNPQTELTIMDGKTHIIESMQISPTIYQLNTSKNGNAFTKTLTEVGDYLTLTIHGMVGETEVATVDVDLARDGVFMEDWTTVDLTSLGEVDGLMFTMDSNDAGAYGVNQPVYFAFDNLKVRFESETATLAVATFEELEVPADGHVSVSTEEDDERTEFVSGGYEFAHGCMSDWDYWYWFGYANRTETKYESLDDQWNNIVGGGYDGSANYGVAFAAEFNGPCYVTPISDKPVVVPGFYITNSSYAYNSMSNGDGFAKKFEKGDWFKLTITGYDADDAMTGTKEYYLADLRDEATAYIINDWRYVDLSVLGEVSKIGFALSSTDGGDWGMNTPAYFCFDNFGATGTEVLPEKNVDVTTGIATINKAKSETIYNIAGQRVAQPTKGMFIVNGQKVMVK